MASCSCGTRDKLNPTPLTRQATVVGLITDTIKPLAYRLLAWHGTILAALIHELVGLLHGRISCGA